MKNKIENIKWIGFFVLVGLTVLIVELSVPTEGQYENVTSLKWLTYICVASAYLVISATRRALDNLYLSLSSEEQKEEFWRQKYAKYEKWLNWKAFLKSMTKAKAIEEEHEIALNHDFDGIQELDNNLPPWWLYMFYITIVFAVIYLVRYELLDAPNQQQEYLTEVAEAEKAIEIYKANQAPVDLTALSGDTGAGKKLFKQNCAVCHGVKGEGKIGPNLTDEFWILGGGVENVYKTISEGGRPGKGMVAWGKSFGPEKIQQLAAYVVSLEGTNPENPKAPQGDKWVNPNAKEVEGENSSEESLETEKPNK